MTPESEGVTCVPGGLVCAVLVAHGTRLSLSPPACQRRTSTVKTAVLDGIDVALDSVRSGAQAGSRRDRFPRVPRPDERGKSPRYHHDDFRCYRDLHHHLGMIIECIPVASLSILAAARGLPLRPLSPVKTPRPIRILLWVRRE